MKKFLILFMALVLVLSLAACGGGNNEEGAGDQGGKDEEKEIEKLTLGFIPSQEADQIADTVEPLEEYLTEELGIPVEAEVMIDFVGLVEGMRTGQIDIGFTNPFGYVQAVDRAGVEVILKAIRNGSDTYKAQFIAPADSELESIEDLVNTEGLSWAYADPLSTSGYLFPAALLMDKGVENLDSHFIKTAVGGHDNAVTAVLDGQADFGTTFDDARDTLIEETPDIKEKIKVIGYTDSIPNDGISVSKQLPEEWKSKIKDAFMAINEKEDVLQIMNEVYSWDGIAEAKDSDYDVVRSVFEKFEEELGE
jgi:phosphonate transport system substrate-binding protein